LTAAVEQEVSKVGLGVNSNKYRVWTVVGGKALLMTQSSQYA